MGEAKERAIFVPLFFALACAKRHHFRGNECITILDNHIAGQRRKMGKWMIRIELLLFIF
jgi:hypothetical protein